MKTAEPMAVVGVPPVTTLVAGQGFQSGPGERWRAAEHLAPLALAGREQSTARVVVAVATEAAVSPVN